MKTYFPRMIDKPMPFLFWEVDDLAVFIVPLIISMPFKEMLVGVIAGAILMRAYSKIKHNKSENFLVHKFWQWGFVNIKDTSPAYIRKFLE